MRPRLFGVLGLKLGGLFVNSGTEMDSNADLLIQDLLLALLPYLTEIQTDAHMKPITLKAASVFRLMSSSAITPVALQMYNVTWST